jgi:hypothetical protein
MTGVSSDDDDFEAGATHLSKTPSHETLLVFFFFFFCATVDSEPSRTTFPHELPINNAENESRKDDETRELSTKRKRVDAGLERSLPRSFFYC